MQTGHFDAGARAYQTGLFLVLALRSTDTQAPHQLGTFLVIFKGNAQVCLLYSLTAFT